MTTTPTIPAHADYCGPQPGEDGPRIAAYRATTYGADGLTPAGSIQVVRCMECGFATYDGRLVESS